MSQIRTWKHLLLLSISILLWAFSPAISLAQTLPCGNIIGPDYTNPGENSLESITTVIEDCEDPFNVTVDPPIPYTLVIDGVDVEEGGTYIQTEPIQEITASGTGEFNLVETFLFKHQNDDYVYVDQWVPEATEDDYRDFASTYFDTEEEINHYLVIALEYYNGVDTGQYFYDEFGEELVDAITGETVVDRYSSFQTAFNNHLDERSVVYEAGTYTILIKESLLTVSQNSLWQNVREFFINTAHAQFDFGPNYYTVTFNIVDAAPEPAKASSILFLPGIQASRLYASEDIGSVNRNEQLWEPSNNAGVSALEMTNEGHSIHNIYTNDIINSVSIDLLFGYQFNAGNIYNDFSLFLDQLKAEGTIADWEPFAYDWRHDVFDIARDGVKVNEYGDSRYLFDIVDDLADKSYSKKVTIIAHSNGGLLAKALMYQLESLGHEDLIDQIIFVGTPHFGTPKAVGTILHGFDQQHGAGFVVGATNARKVINNMPGAYYLLPSEAYFDTDLSRSIVVTDEGVDISSFQDYKNYLIGGNRESSLDVHIKIPARANSLLLDDALLNHKDKLDSWIPPTTTKVNSIIGVGIPTMRGMYYDIVQERQCDSQFSTLLFCVVEGEPTPMATLSSYGDGTVVMSSAEGGSVGQRFYVDLAQISIENVNRGKSIINHSNIVESLDVQNLIHNLILSVTDMQVNENISKERPEINGRFTTQKIASPVQISSTDTEGRTTGVVYENNQWVLKKEIPDSDYFEFAGVRYLITPQTSEIETKLDGDGYGGYSYYIDDMNADGNVTNRISIINATTTPDMLANISVTNISTSELSIDENGDGVTDATIEPDSGVYSLVLKSEDNLDFVEIKKGSKSGKRIKRNVTPQGLVLGISEAPINPTEEEYRKALFNIFERLIQILNKLLVLKGQANN